MKYAIELLNSILSKSKPDDTITLTPDEAEMIGQLNEWELGPLARAISRMGVVPALEKKGLFARTVIVRNTG